MAGRVGLLINRGTNKMRGMNRVQGTITETIELIEMRDMTDLIDVRKRTRI